MALYAVLCVLAWVMSQSMSQKLPAHTGSSIFCCESFRVSLKHTAGEKTKGPGVTEVLSRSLPQSEKVNRILQLVTHTHTRNLQALVSIYFR
jgi:hypothetical protein